MSLNRTVQAWALSRWFVLLTAIVAVGIVVSYGLTNNGGITLLWGVLLGVAFVRYLLWRRRKMSGPSR